MLLVEKVANKVSRQSAQDAHSPLELPIALLNSAPLPVRIQAVVDILEEAQRLVTRTLTPDDTKPLFLQPISEDVNSSTSLFKRRAQSLVVFVGSAFNTPLPKTATQTAQPERVVKGLVALATLELPEVYQDITKASLAALNNLLGVLSAQSFVQAIASIMETDVERASSPLPDAVLNSVLISYPRSKLVPSTF